MKSVRYVLAAALLLPAIMALATMAHNKEFVAHYKIKPDSKLAKLHCSLCHAAVPKLNPYGADIKAAMTKLDVKTLTDEVFKATEKLDSDKDGVKNIDEIKADSAPGNAKVKPAREKPAD